MGMPKIKNKQTSLYIAISLLAVIIVGAIIINFFNPNPNPNTPNPSAQTPKATEYIGMSETEAMLKAKQNNTPARVIEHEGESLATTMDFVEGRLNFYVKDLKVYKVDVEHSN